MNSRACAVIGGTTNATIVQITAIAAAYAASTPAQAWRQIEAWTGSPSLHLLAENKDSLAVLKSLLTRPRVRGPVVHDARVVALCLAHGVSTLLTRDRDFSLFPELPCRNPFRE